MTVAMARQYWRPSNMLYPVPAVMISCADEEGRSNIMTAAWTGTICSDPVMVSVSIRPERYSHGIITRTGEFVINLTTEQLTYATDFCGVRSGRDADKWEVCGFTKEEAKEISCPLIAESPVSIECRVKSSVPLGSHTMFIAEVLAVHADEQYMGGDGAFDLDLADPIVYSHGVYRGLGKKLGTFGYSVKKSARKKTKKQVRHKTDK